jgi:hypothetical protein
MSEPKNQEHKNGLASFYQQQPSQEHLWAIHATGEATVINAL